MPEELVDRGEPVTDVLVAGHSLSPGLSFRWAATARSVAAPAPYRCSIVWLRQPASRMRSPSEPPSASHSWANV